MQVDILKWFTGLQNEALNAIVSVLTFMGTETFYLIILPILYWCVSKRWGFRLAYAFAASALINFIVKDWAGVKRPIGIEGIHSNLEATDVNHPLYPYDSFPSGHAQLSTTFWLSTAWVLKRTWMWVLAFTMMVCIASARLYSGVHWTTDVLAGMLLGALVAVIAMWFSHSPLMIRLSDPLKWLGLILFPAVLYVLFPGADQAKVAGFLIGASIANGIEQRSIRFDLHTSIWKKGIAILIGLAGLLVIKSLIKSALPVAAWSDLIRYGVMGLWVFAMGPWLFVKLKLYRETNQYKVRNPA